MKIGRRIGHAPQGRRPPFVGQRAIVRLGIGILRGRLAIRTASLQRLAHAVQKQVAVNPIHRAEIGRVTIGAADVGKNFLAMGRHRLELSWPRQGSDERRQLIALIQRQIHAHLLIVWLTERRGLRMARVAQPQLVGTGGLNKFGQAGGLRLPAEPANAAVGQPMRSSDRRGLIVGWRQAIIQPFLAFVGDDVALGDFVDQLDAEQSRRIAFRNVNAGRKTERRGAISHGIARQQVGRQARSIRQIRVKLAQRFLESTSCLQVNDPFTSFCLAVSLDDEGGDVVFEAAGAAHAALVMACFTGIGIEDGSQAVAPICQRIFGRPFTVKQRFSCPSHVVIDFRMARRAPSQHAESGR